MAMEIDLIDEQLFLDKTKKKYILETTECILKYIKLPQNTELCISIVDDANMRQLNKEYRNIDRTTDILSFPQNIEPKNYMLGDIVISYQTALRHSEKYKITIYEEFRKLLIHGILHLLGYDHKKKKDTKLMREKEKEIALFLSEC